MLRFFLLLGCVAGFALPASAELFKCRGPDGRMIFTDQKEQCPGADPFTPEAVIHKAEPPAAAATGAGVDARPDPASARRKARLVREAEESQAAHWRQKKTAAETELVEIAERRDWLQQYVAHCNRGGTITTRDDAGIKQVVKCSVIKDEFYSLDARASEVQAYLDEGLRDECRKAGCLPGWIR